MFLSFFILHYIPPCHPYITICFVGMIFPTCTLSFQYFLCNKNAHAAGGGVTYYVHIATALHSSCVLLYLATVQCETTVTASFSASTVSDCIIHNHSLQCSVGLLLLTMHLYTWVHIVRKLHLTGRLDA